MLHRIDVFERCEANMEGTVLARIFLDEDTREPINPDYLFDAWTSRRIQQLGSYETGDDDRHIVTLYHSIIDYEIQNKETK